MLTCVHFTVSDLSLEEHDRPEPCYLKTAVSGMEEVAPNECKPFRKCHSLALYFPSPHRLHMTPRFNTRLYFYTSYPKPRLQKDPRAPRPHVSSHLKCYHICVAFGSGGSLRTHAVGLLELLSEQPRGRPCVLYAEEEEGMSR